MAANNASPENRGTASEGGGGMVREPVDGEWVGRIVWSVRARLGPFRGGCLIDIVALFKRRPSFGNERLQSVCRKSSAFAFPCYGAPRRGLGVGGRGSGELPVHDPCSSKCGIVLPQNHSGIAKIRQRCNFYIYNAILSRSLHSGLCYPLRNTSCSSVRRIACVRLIW